MQSDYLRMWIAREGKLSWMWDPRHIFWEGRDVRSKEGRDVSWAGTLVMFRLKQVDLNLSLTKLHSSGTDGTIQVRWKIETTKNYLLVLLILQAVNFPSTISQLPVSYFPSPTQRWNHASSRDSNPGQKIPQHTPELFAGKENYWEGWKQKWLDQEWRWRYDHSRYCCEWSSIARGEWDRSRR